MGPRHPSPLAGREPQQPGATDADLEFAEKALSVTFPDDYRAFLQWSDGWEGWTGEAYLALHAIIDLIWFNVEEEDRRLYPGVVQIGGDGGLETFALDYRSGSGMRGLVAFDRVAGLESIRRLGPTFQAGIQRLIDEPNGPWDEDETEP